MSGYSGASAYRPRRGRARRGRGPRQYSLSAFFFAYLGAILSCVLVAMVAPGVLLVAYPVAGVVLSRFIGRRVHWWNQADSIANVASTKLHTILAWPIAVPAFIAEVFVAKFL